MKIKLDKGAIMPTRAHDTDAGLDIYTPTRIVLWGRTFETVDTGVHVEIPQGYVGLLKSKSGLMRWDGITTEGTIDSGYSGSICVTLCPKGVLKLEQETVQVKDQEACIGCRQCEYHCPDFAITIGEDDNG